MRSLPVLVAVLILASGATHAATSPLSPATGLPAPAARLVLPGRDHALLFQEDAVLPRSAPLRYAVGEPVSVAALPAADRPGAKAMPVGGEWSRLPDGRALWRLDVRAPGALALGFGFRRMFLPQGTELWFTSADGKHVQGPYSDADNSRYGGFWSGLVPGEESVIEVALPEAMKRYLVLELETVNHAYRDILDDATLSSKSLSCEIDVACPEGDNYRDPIRAVARYVFQSGSSGFLCTGQALNNTGNDRKRYFHTAEHCIGNQTQANTMVLYWKYQSPTCRAPGSGASGTPLPDNTAVMQTGGATLRAHYGGSDVSLVELNTAIPGGAEAFFAGWDRRESLPPSTAVIHHARGDEKRISLDFNSPVLQDLALELPGEGNEPPIEFQPNKYVSVTYDRGTTEGGSSGAGLFSDAGRLIGQLGGGPEGSCSFGITDYYGWLAQSWEGGGAAGSRLKDWLDPGNSGAELIDGSNNCAAPQVALTAPDTAVAGTAISLSLSATGAGPYTVTWDVDGDGVADRTVSGVNGTTALPVNFPSETNVVVRVRAVDASGCAGEAAKAVVVTGPSIGVTLAGQPAQICGNNDAVIDPGERWNVPVFVFNSLNATKLAGAYAIFSRPYQGVAQPVRGPDAFGYVAADDSNGSGCGYAFVELEGQAGAQALTAASASQDAVDEGHTAPLQFAPAVNFYGTATDTLVMSTNGYLSTDPGDDGSDYFNLCGLVAPDFGGGGRFNVLHDDLVVGAQNQSGLRALSFPVCPRRAESVSGDTSCVVFQWSHMGQYTGSTPAGDITFEAILYPATGQIVYQYKSAPDDLGAGSTVGIQNAAVTSGLEYSCGDPSIQPKRSICFFRPGSPALAPTTAPALRIETPAVALPNLAPGGGQVVNVPFAVRPDAACGSRLQLQYVGMVQPDSSSSIGRQTLVDTTIGSPSCAPTQACPAQVTPINLADGLYFNPKRSGNGEGIFTIPVGAEKTVFSAWFTAEGDRKPIWYIVQDTLRDNQVVAPIFRFRQNTGSPTFSTSKAVVGTAQATWLSPTTYAFTWNLDGVPGGQLEQRLYQLAPSTTPNRTGVWYFPLQGGWGQVLDDHFLGQATEQVAVNYIYDSSGAPRWDLGGAADINQGAMSLNQFAVHCPTCPNLTDFFAVRQATGTLTRTFSSITSGTLSTQITFQPPLVGTWVRDNVPILMISAPQQQNP